MKAKNNDSKKRSLPHVVVVAAIFIIVGLMMLGRNMGFVDYHIYRILISWQMLLVVLGLMGLARKNYSSAVILIGIGAFFLIPLITGAPGNWMRIYWPLVFVFIGLGLLLKAKDRKAVREGRGRGGDGDGKVVYDTDEGFVESDTSLGSVRQIVLDPVFRGARLRTSLGSTVLDLRRTTLEPGDTYIDIECSFGGVEIYVPDGWNVISEASTALGGWDDKRINNYVAENDARLVIRGRITFGGVEIKN